MQQKQFEVRTTEAKFCALSQHMHTTLLEQQFLAENDPTICWFQPDHNRMYIQ